jgi:hypothetical protein
MTTRLYTGKELNQKYGFKLWIFEYRGKKAKPILICEGMRNELFAMTLEAMI